MTTAGGTQHTLTKADAPGLPKAQADTAALALAISKEVGLVKRGAGTNASDTTDEDVAAAVNAAGTAIAAAG